MLRRNTWVFTAVLIIFALALAVVFPVDDGEYYVTHFIEPKGKENKMFDMVLKGDSAIVKYLQQEKRVLSRDLLYISTRFLGMWEEERDDIRSRGINVFMPMISRDRLIAIMALGYKQSGRYTLEDTTLLDEITGRVAVSMEKEYLREQLREREIELSIINRCSAIIASSLNIQEIYENFVGELKKVLDIVRIVERST